MGTVLLFGFGPTRSVYHPPGLTHGFGAVGNVLAAPAARWDGAWYLTIAHYGYLPQLGHYTASRAAFFPLYPLLVGLVSSVGPAGALSGVIVSLLALLAALYGLHRLTMLELAAPGSRLPGAWRGFKDRASPSGTGCVGSGVASLALRLIAFAPMAFFLSADYSESLYLALSIGVFLCARRGRWLWVGVLGGLAAATRSTGVVLLAPALVLYLYGPREDVGEHYLSEDVPGEVVSRAHTLSASTASLLSRLRPRYPLRADALSLALIPAGLLAFIGWFSLAGGEALAPLHAQSLWDRHFAGPYVAAFDGLEAAFEGARQLISGQSAHLYFALEGKSPFIQDGRNLMLFAFLALAVPATIGVLRRLPFAYGLYLLVALLLPLSYPVATQPLMSLPRFLLVLFPFYIWLASYLGGRPRARVATLAISALLLVFFTAQFSTWHWVS